LHCERKERGIKVAEATSAKYRAELLNGSKPAVPGAAHTPASYSSAPALARTSSAFCHRPFSAVFAVTERAWPQSVRPGLVGIETAPRRRALNDLVK
jgi:hypothetical protein